MSLADVQKFPGLEDTRMTRIREAGGKLRTCSGTGMRSCGTQDRRWRCRTAKSVACVGWGADFLLALPMQAGIASSPNLRQSFLEKVWYCCRIAVVPFPRAWRSRASQVGASRATLTRRRFPGDTRRRPPFRFPGRDDYRCSNFTLGPPVSPEQGNCGISELRTMPLAACYAVVVWTPGGPTGRIGHPGCPRRFAFWGILAWQGIQGGNRMTVRRGSRDTNLTPQSGIKQGPVFQHGPRNLRWSRIGLMVQQ